MTMQMTEKQQDYLTRLIEDTIEQIDPKREFSKGLASFLRTLAQRPLAREQASYLISLSGGFKELWLSAILVNQGRATLPKDLKRRWIIQQMVEAL